MDASSYITLVSDFQERYVRACEDRDHCVLLSVLTALRDASESDKRLKALNFSGNSREMRNRRLDDEYVLTLLIPLSGAVFLEDIDLSYNEITCKGAEEIAAFLKDDKYLKRLSLKCNSIEEKGGVALAVAIQMNETLKALDVSLNSIGDKAGVQFASSLQINTNLQVLNLSTCRLGASSILALSTVLQTNDSLLSLDISNNKINASLESDVCYHLSKMIRRNTSLGYINLSKLSISDWATVNHLSNAIKENMRIRVLDLSCNRITRDGCISLSMNLSTVQKTLTFLSLSCCAIQDEGAEAIGLCLTRNTALTTLYVDYNKITGIGLRAIARALHSNQTLVRLALWGNAFSELIGGPIRSVETDNSKVKLVVDAKGDVHQWDSNVAQMQQQKGMTRLYRDDVDFAFYSVDGTLSAAKNSVFGRKIE
ncbi:hypothetical protein HDU77_009889 [Chytriomyces hyalinus]|nr:hypothetical protein HDU77_009889 [Chytriomyces hyalinus]